MKKLNKFFAVLVALAMMATLCVSMAFAAPAYDGTDKAIKGGTAADPATGVITKVLKAGKGTQLPDSLTFTFNYNQKKAATDAEAGLQTAAATITPRTVTFTKAASTAANSTTDTDIYVGTVDLYDFDSETAKTVNNSFPKVGRYQFVVDEAQFADADPYDYTLSKAEYLLTVDVAQTDAGDRYVANIAVQQTKTDTTTEGAAAEGTKVDPTPGTKDSDEDGTVETADGSGFQFTNFVTQKTNVKPDGEDEPTTKDNTGLYVEKQVKTNTGADVANDSNAAAQDFTFDITVKIPEAAKQAGRTKYTAVVIDTDETVAEGATPTVIKTYEFEDNQPATFTLKDGYRLVFKDLDIGAVYSVSEQADNGYATTYASKADDTDYTTAASEKNVTLKKDYVGVINTAKQSDTPTGILISNLPYIALALVAIGGLVAYVVVRRRQSDEA